MDEELTLGAGLGESACRGWNGHGNAGEDDTTPPEEGAGAGDGPRLVEFWLTFTAYFSEASHVFKVPLLKVK